MNKKPGLLFTVCVLAMIILATSFNMNFGSNPPVRLPNGVKPDNVLYVCPIASSVWDSLATAFRYFSKYAYVLLSFAVIVLMFSWGWALYQNLLKDKFNADAYKNSWDLTKVIFWMAVVVTIFFMTPNHFRRVDVKGSKSQWVLCENTSTGAKAVKSGFVTFR